MALQIDYKLTGSGWAECTIADGEKSCTVTVSYLTDALGDLVLAAVAQLHWFNGLSFLALSRSPANSDGSLHQVSTCDDVELKILDFTTSMKGNLIVTTTFSHGM